MNINELTKKEIKEIETELLALAAQLIEEEESRQLLDEIELQI
jgi:hypothetical protein